jgi:hypothetical protein
MHFHWQLSSVDDLVKGLSEKEGRFEIAGLMDTCSVSNGFLELISFGVLNDVTEITL